MGRLRIPATNWQRAVLGVLLLATAFVMVPGGYSQTQTYRQTIHPMAATVPVAATVPAPPPAATTPTPPAVSPMDEPLRLVHLARQSYQQVRDYSCIMVKRETMKGQMQPEHIIAMKLRNQPFSVYLKWLSPKTMEGQEGCYVAGKNNGMMRVKPAGVLGVVGFVSLDLKDPRVAENSRHSITDAGIGNMINRLVKGWELEKQQNNHTLVGVAEYEFAKRPCTRVEICRPQSKPGQFYSYRYIIYFDKEFHLPVRAEAYDWPQPGGNPAGELMECYSYLNLKFNTGLSDLDFNK